MCGVFITIAHGISHSAVTCILVVLLLCYAVTLKLPNVMVVVVVGGQVSYWVEICHGKFKHSQKSGEKTSILKPFLGQLLTQLGICTRYNHGYIFFHNNLIFALPDFSKSLNY